MNAQIIPFPTSRTSLVRPAPIRQITIDGEYAEDDVLLEVFDAEADIDELSTYVHIADTWND